MKKITSLLICSIILLLSSSETRSQNTRLWDKDSQGAFVTDVNVDEQKRLWITTEDKGVWQRNLNFIESDWNFVSPGGKAAFDPIYAVATDRKGRTWLGTLNRGVRVGNGKEWRDYGPIEGPVGERIFDIAISPLNGDVWMATSAGLTRYSEKEDTWRHYTTADGLPVNQIQTLAFAKDGTLFAGTQCDGITIAASQSEYSKWETVQGPDLPSPIPAGAGLPANQINKIIVARSGAVYAATTFGLAVSNNNGKMWAFTRASNYVDKLKGVFQAPRRWNPQPGATLKEDYITSLAEGDDGSITLAIVSEVGKFSTPQQVKHVRAETPIM